MAVLRCGAGDARLRHSGRRLMSAAMQLALLLGLGLAMANADPITLTVDKAGGYAVTVGSLSAFALLPLP